MSALTTKLFREIRRLRGQLVSIALVVGAGIMSAVTMRSTYASLERARDSYYDDYRFADVFASLQRAPNAVLSQVSAIPGVAVAEARVKKSVNLSVPGLDQPATGLLVSLPPVGDPVLNRLHITLGRMPDPQAGDEILVSDRFADWNHLMPGDTLSAVVNGRLHHLRITGRTLSPEYIYEVEPGAGLFVSDERLFGVLWMPGRALAATTDMAGAFNDVSLTLAPGAREKSVIEALDDILRPYGGLGAYGRSEQLSSRVVSDELKQNRVTADILPIVFLSVAAFLLHIVLHRLVATQRVNIATLKAFGYDNLRIGIHYSMFAVLAVCAGVILGLIGGRWLGSAYTGMYAELFRFPDLRFVMSWPTFAFAAAISGAAALIGAASAVRIAVNLQAAEGMNPAPPARFRRLLLERLDLHRLLTPVQRMVMRNVERRPLRALLSALGVGAGFAVMLMGFNMLDSITTMVDLQFRDAQRENVSVSYQNEQPVRAQREVERIDGVQRAESFRVVPVRLRHGHYTRRVAMTALSRDGILRPMLDSRRARHALPPGGLVLTDRLAAALAVGTGDTVTVTRLDQTATDRRVIVSGIVDEIAGFNAYTSDDALHHLFQEAPRVSGAYLAIERGREADVVRALQQRPDVAGVFSKSAGLRAFDQQLAKSMRITVTIMFVLAAVLASGVVYNGARIALSERGHEFATLRVMGFSGREVTAMMLGEQAAVTALGVPVGIGMGAGVTLIVVRGITTEQYRVPFVMTLQSISISVVAVALIAAASGWLVRRLLLHLDLIAALKVRE